MWVLADEIKSIPGVKIHGTLKEEKYLIFHDSRKPIVGGLFWALKGNHFDGHDFISLVLEKGACGVVGERWPEDCKLSSQIVWIEISDSLKALQFVAQKRVGLLKKQGVKILGITGSNGKTTSKEFTAQMLEKIFNKTQVHSNKGSFNNHLGVPFNILSAPLAIQFLICELGMNHGGEIAFLSQIAQPDVVVCTMVGTAHIENFGSQEGIAKAKQEIYLANPQAIAIFNLSNFWTLKMAKEDHRPMRYFFAEKNKNLDPSIIPHVELEAQTISNGYLKIQGIIDSCSEEVIVPIVGEHQVTNIMTAASLLLALGIKAEKIWEALSSLKTSWGRNQLVESKMRCHILFDGYNANPESMKALLDTVKNFSSLGKKKIAVLGEMKELGDFSENAHFELGRFCAQAPLDYVVFIGHYGDFFRKGFLEVSSNHEKIMVASDYNDHVAYQLKSLIEEGDFVFIKGSRGMKMERVVKSLEPINFSDLY